MSRDYAVRPFAARTMLLVLAAAVLALALPAAAQQHYVSRYNVYAGYCFLDSPKVSLTTKGVHFQVGMRPKTWLDLGFDYSNTRGDLTLSPDLLLPTLQQTLAAQLTQLVKAGVIPPSYTLAVPAHSVTQTFAAGPQLSFRQLPFVTFFLRPDLGAIKERATPKPADAIAKGVVAQLAPSGYKDEWKLFYGVGGGMDFGFSKHVALRVQADFVRDHLFDDLLKDARNTVRFSIGPTFNFGKNISE